MLALVLSVLFAGGDLLPARTTAKPVIQLLPSDQHEAWMAALPKTLSGRLEKALGMKFFLYDESVMPQAFQLENDKGSTFHWMGYNLAGSLDVSGSPNPEHPWKNGLGLDNCSNVPQVKLIAFPAASLPLRWKWKELGGAHDSLAPFSYSNPPRKVRYIEYPVGTHTFELIATKDPETGKLLPQILRSRFKAAENDWQISVEMPFDTVTGFYQFVNSHGGVEDKVSLKAHYQNNFLDVVSFNLPTVDKELGQRSRSGQVARSGLSDSLPRLSPGLVRRMLSRPFTRLDESRPWRTTKDSQLVTYAPTSTEEFNLVPKGYTGGAIPPTKKDCLLCHGQTLAHANHLDNTRDWYGRVRGFDTVFSVHYEEPSTISYNGVTVKTELRKAFVDSGIISPLPQQE